MGSFSLGQIGPCLQSFARGKLAAKEVFKILDEKQIKEQNYETINNDSLNGQIQFRNVSFTYPTKQEVQVLKQVSFSIPQGKKIAFVGESGSGKSTIAQLLLKFYEIDSGTILIGEDEIPLSQIGKEQFRQKVAIVSQEPALFDIVQSKKINFLYMVQHLRFLQRKKQLQKLVIIIIINASFKPI